MRARIVIAAGEPSLRLLIRHSIADIEDEGGEIIVTEDGPATLAAVEREEPVLVLIDVTLSGMNGVEVCARLRANTALRQPHIILLTDRGQIDDRLRGVEAGADRCMTKPFNPDDLLDAVRAALF